VIRAVVVAAVVVLTVMVVMVMVPMMVLTGLMVMVMMMVSGWIVRPVAGLGGSSAADSDGDGGRRDGDKPHLGARDHCVPPRFRSFDCGLT